MQNVGFGEQDICGDVLSTPSVPMSGAASVLQVLFAVSALPEHLA